MNSDSPKYVIIGNGAAAISAATKIRTIDKSGIIMIFGEEPFLYYYRPRLPDLLSGDAEISGITIRHPDWYENLSIIVRTDVGITHVEPSRHVITTTAGETVPYSRLLFATGSRAFRPDKFRINHPSIFTFRTAADALALKAACEGKKNAVMIGGGILALEVAIHLCKLGMAVTVVEIANHLLPRQLDDEGGKFLQTLLELRGLSFHLGRSTSEVITAGNSISVKLDNDVPISGDVLVVCAGVVPEVEIARRAGLPVGRGIVVDNTMRTSSPDIWAAGDCAEYEGRNVGLWQAALAQGTCAGANMAGMEEPCKKISNTAKIKIAGIELLSSGIIDNDSFRPITYRSDTVFRRIFLENGCPRGVILFGDLTGEKEILSAISNKTDLSAWGDRPIDPGFEWIKTS